MAWEKGGFKFKIIFISLVAITGLLFLASNMNLVSAACADPCLAVSPVTFYFTAVQGGANPSYQNLTISEPTLGGLGPWDSVVTEPWLNLGSIFRVSSSLIKVEVRVNIAGLTVGNYTGTIYICDPNFPPCDATNSIQGAVAMSEVTLTVTPPPVFCGDGTCSPPGENSTSCPNDCIAGFCGNGVIDVNETCDPPLLNSAQCPSTAKTCNSICQCISQCGNGVIEPGEQCDSTNLNNQTCASQGFTSGTLSCTASCTFAGSCTFNPPPVCTLDSASWDITQTLEGNVVSFRVMTTNCVGQAMSFEVRESDLIGSNPVNINPTNVSVPSGGTAVSSWRAEWQQDISGDPEYIFTATLISNPGTNIDSSNQLEVSQITPPFCDTVTKCSDYNQTTCQNDVCGVADSSVPPSQADCSDTNNIDCFCSWNNATSVCGPNWSPIINNTNSSGRIIPGFCHYEENITDTCDDDGFLTVDFDAVWVWDLIACDSACRVNNQDEATKCASTTEAFQCPAEIPLSFFNVYNLLAALVLIAIVYWAINLRKRKGKKNRKR